jgi:hypothetical protein
MLLNVKAVKQFFKTAGRQIRKEVPEIINIKVEEGLKKAVEMTPGHGRIGATEIIMAFSGVKKES